MSRWFRAYVQVPAAAMVALASVAMAEEPPAEDDLLLQRILVEGTVDAEWIAPAVRAQLTPELIARVVGQVRAAAGALEAVTPTGDQWEVTFENGTMTVAMSRDEEGRLTGIWFNEVMPRDLTVEQVVAAMDELEGETALLVVAGDTVLGERNADAELLVGSAFKLAVLAAVRDAVEAGTLQWDQVVRVDATQASLPTGMLQSYPDGHPVTVATVAAMMISVSDNTATDLLMDLVGRDQVEAIAGFAPVLTTAEYFKLKADAGLYRRYLGATLPERRQILDELRSVDLPPVAAVANGRTAHGWRLSVRALCDMMATVGDLELLSINPGAVPEIDWTQVAFKGGSDQGLVNLTHRLTPAEGPPICISVTWNDDRVVDEDGVARLVARLSHALRDAN